MSLGGTINVQMISFAMPSSVERQKTIIRMQEIYFSDFLLTLGKINEASLKAGGHNLIIL